MNHNHLKHSQQHDNDSHLRRAAQAAEVRRENAVEDRLVAQAARMVPNITDEQISEVVGH